MIITESPLSQIERFVDELSADIKKLIKVMTSVVGALIAFIMGLYGIVVKCLVFKKRCERNLFEV